MLAESERRAGRVRSSGCSGTRAAARWRCCTRRATQRVRALVTWASIASVVRWTEAQMADWRERGHLDVPNTRTGQCSS